MTRKTTSVAILSLLLLAFLGTTIFAAQSPQKRVNSAEINKSMYYSLPYPDESIVSQGAPSREPVTQQLGAASPSQAPGAVVGVTWYDYQHNGTMGHMNATRTNTQTLAHFSWMYLGTAVQTARKYQYRSFDFGTNSFNAVLGLQTNDDYAGYVNLDATNDNRAVVGGHNTQGIDAHTDPHFYWDFAEGLNLFAAEDQVPQAIQSYAQQVAGQSVIWPKFAYVEGPSDTVLHVIAQVSMAAAADPQAIYYFRRPSSDLAPGPWDNPPYVIDTVYDLAHMVEATDDGKVALAWTANPPCTFADPADASCNVARTEGNPSGYNTQYDNDVYYQTSDDYGVTWGPVVNLTDVRQYEQAGKDHYKAYTDLNTLYDSQGNLHIVWNGHYDPLETGLTTLNSWFSRMFHWSENQPYVRVAHQTDWMPGGPAETDPFCAPGSWQLMSAKMSVSECRGKIYLLFVQWNSDSFDDCIVDTAPSGLDGRTEPNGDLYVVVSADGGLTWDAARKVTDSYTPYCDSVGGTGGPCDNNHWPSMARYGNQATTNQTDVIVPAGGTDPGWYLDIQYINDHSAGGIVQDEGWWQQADVRWVRLACVDEVPNPNPAWNPSGIGYPAWTKAGVPWSRDVVIENIGNAPYQYTVSTSEDPSSDLTGWLGAANFGTSCGFGINNTVTGQVQVTPTGASAGNIYILKGWVIFTGTNIARTDSVSIDFIVADTVYPIETQVISTRLGASAVLSLQIANNGEFGGDAVNRGLDYVQAPSPYTDCNPDALYYLYSGSPVVLTNTGSDTLGSWSVFGQGPSTEVGFFPVSNSSAGIEGSNEVYRATMVTRDSTIAIEKTWFAPQSTGDSVTFMIQRLTFTSNDGADHSGLTFGEFVDWDVPADSGGSDNGSDFDDLTDEMIWQYGAEWHQDDTNTCQDNDIRMGAIKFIEMYTSTVAEPDVFIDASADLEPVLGHAIPYGAYTADNATYVYPYTDLTGMDAAQLYQKMSTSGWSKFLSVAADSEFVDLHTAMTFVHDYTLKADTALTVYLAYITVLDGGTTELQATADKASQWFLDHVKPATGGCCDVRGDANNDGSADVGDLTYLVNFLFKGGPPPVCDVEGDANSDGSADVGDLTFLVNFLFKGGPPPGPC